MAFERVYTVSDFFDGPRSGVADYSSRPHHYACEWDDGADEYAETFALREIDNGTLALVLKQWEIWRQWEYAFHRGLVSRETHPGLPGNHPRYVQLKVEIAARVANGPSKPTRARAEFRVDPHRRTDLPAGMMRTLQVQWNVV